MYRKAEIYRMFDKLSSLVYSQVLSLMSKPIVTKDTPHSIEICLEVRKMVYVLWCSIIFYNLYEAGIFYVALARGVLLFSHLKDVFLYTSSIATKIQAYNESLLLGLKRNLIIQLVCMSPSHKDLLKEELRNNFCLNHPFKKVTYVFISVIFHCIIISKVFFEHKLLILLCFLVFFEYRYNFNQFISISLKCQASSDDEQQLNKKVYFNPGTPSFIKPLPTKPAFHLVNSFKLSKNTDDSSPYNNTLSTVSKKLTYSTKTNVKDLKKYGPKPGNNINKSIFFDITSKEGLGLWGEYLKKLNSNSKKTIKNISPMVEDFKIVDTKFDIDIELEKMKESGQLKKYLDLQYRRVFITELRVWVTKNRLARVAG